MFSNKNSHVLIKLIVHVSTYDLLLLKSIKGLKYFLYMSYYSVGLKFHLLENLFDLCLQKILLMCKNLYLWKTSLIKLMFFVENFLDCRKLPSLWKIFLTEENFLDCGKFPWLPKFSLIVENLVYCGEFFQLWKISLIVENLLNMINTIFIITFSFIR